MLQRIRKIIEERKLTATSFADAIGVQRPAVSHVLSGRNRPSLDFVTKILSRYPDIDPDWLLFGKGSMYRAKEKPSPSPDGKSSIKSASGGIESRPDPATGSGSSEIERIIVLFRGGSFSEYRPYE